ncbi:hypothetical protein HDU97_001766 [Phlyctochytrium planicorne]|nr:hypothetical protein HDU97_001766 [Phlyctochytrium planicorne]
MGDFALWKEEAIEDFENLLHSTLSKDLSSEIETIIEETRKSGRARSLSTQSERRQSHPEFVPRSSQAKSERDDPIPSQFRPFSSLSGRSTVVPDEKPDDRELDGSVSISQAELLGKRVENLESKVSDEIPFEKADGITMPTPKGKAKDLSGCRSSECQCESLREEMDELKRFLGVSNTSRTFSDAVKSCVHDELQKSGKEVLEKIISPMVAEEMAEFEQRLNRVARKSFPNGLVDSGFQSPSGDKSEPRWRDKVARQKPVRAPSLPLAQAETQSRSDDSDDLNELFTKLRRVLRRHSAVPISTTKPPLQVDEFPVRTLKTERNSVASRQHYARPTLASVLKSKKYETS